MTRLDTTKKQVRDNIFNTILHNQVTYMEYEHWYILNRQNVSEKWIEFGKYIDEEYGIIKWYIKNNKVVPKWFNDFFVFKEEIEVYNYKKGKKR